MSIVVFSSVENILSVVWIKNSETHVQIYFFYQGEIQILWWDTLIILLLLMYRV